MILNPWMMKEILQERKNRDNLKKKWIESGHPKNSLVHNSYKASRNIVVKMVRDAKRKNIYEGCEKANGDGKKTWKVIRKAMNVKFKPDVTPNFVRTGTVADDNLKKIKNKTDIANVMNRQFYINNIANFTLKAINYILGFAITPPPQF